MTLRGIAREIGVSPAALYGYFDSLEALFTALIVDGYEDLADAVAAAAAQPGSPGFAAARERAAPSAAGRSPTPPSFRLLYFSPLPGYEAPPDGETMAASLRGVRPDARASSSAASATARCRPPPPGPDVDPTKFHEYFGLEICAAELRMTTECWAEFHGLVALEVNGHILDHWVDPEALFDANMIATIRRMGFTLD